MDFRGKWRSFVVKKTTMKNQVIMLCLFLSFVEITGAQTPDLIKEVKKNTKVVVGQPNKENEIKNTPSKTNSSNQQQLSARVDGSNIVLSDGRVYTWSRQKTNSLSVLIEMLEPLDARVSISYDDKEVHQTDIPFVYAEKNWNYQTSYVRLSVKEVSGTTWSVKLKNEVGYKLVVQGSATNPSSVPAAQRPASTRTTSVSNCTSPMPAESFARAVSSIENQAFEEDMIRVFKQMLSNNCITVNQLIKVMGTFSFEEDMLKVAKIGYPKVTDKENFFMVNDLFSYSESIQNLNKWLEAQ